MALNGVILIGVLAPAVGSAGAGLALVARGFTRWADELGRIAIGDPRPLLPVALNYRRQRLHDADHLVEQCLIGRGQVRVCLARVVEAVPIRPSPVQSPVCKPGGAFRQRGAVRLVQEEPVAGRRDPAGAVVYVGQVVQLIHGLALQSVGGRA